MICLDRRVVLHWKQNIIYKMCDPQHLTTLQASAAYYRDNFIFFTFTLPHIRLFSKGYSVSYEVCMFSFGVVEDDRWIMKDNYWERM
jgi:hypothetical protein